MRFANFWASRLTFAWMLCVDGHAASITNLATLQSNLHACISQSRFDAAMWGVKVVSLDSGKTIFEHNAGKLLKPASNAKLFTAALALDRFGPDYRIKTSLYSAVRPDKSGNLKGDLVVYGRGDPSFAERFNGGSYETILRRLVNAIADAGIRHIKGDLIGDESYFRGPPFGSQWTWDDLQNYYGAESSALSIQDNVMDLVFEPGDRIGLPCRIITKPDTAYLSFSNRTVTVEAGGRRRISIYRPVGENVVYLGGWMPLDGPNMIEAVTVHRPALWFVTLLKEALAARGIRVSGKLRAMDWLDRRVHPLDFDAMIELASVTSAPLNEILRKLMKSSQNLYAHLLLLQVGANWRLPPDPHDTTEEIGLAEMRIFLEKEGINEEDVLLEEGSGLSRGALLTPNVIVSLLQYLRKREWFEVFRDSLPLAGIDGTLRNRLKDTAVMGNVRAKTGTLRYVNTLSGYLTNRSGENLVFSFMLNNYDGSGGRTALDAMTVMLAEH